MPTLHIASDQLTLSVEHDFPLIRLDESHQTSILFGCRDGACGSCMIRVSAGAENLSPMSEDERDFLETMAAEPNERLACQCRVRGDVTLSASD